MDLGLIVIYVILFILSPLLAFLLNHLTRFLYRTIKKNLLPKVGKMGLEAWLNLVLKTERILYITLSSFYLALLILGLFSIIF